MKSESLQPATVSPSVVVDADGKISNNSLNKSRSSKLRGELPETMIMDQRVVSEQLELQPDIGQAQSDHFARHVELLREELVLRLADLPWDVSGRVLRTIIDNYQTFMAADFSLIKLLSPASSPETLSKELHFAATCSEMLFERLGCEYLLALEGDENRRRDTALLWSSIKKMHHVAGIMRRSYWLELKSTIC